MFNSQQIEFLENVANSMLRDGVTPEQFLEHSDAMTKAYMQSVIKNTTTISNAFMTNQDFRNNSLNAIIDCVKQC